MTIDTITTLSVEFARLQNRSKTECVSLIDVHNVYTKFLSYTERLRYLDRHTSKRNVASWLAWRRRGGGRTLKYVLVILHHVQQLVHEQIA